MKRLRVLDMNEPGMVGEDEPSARLLESGTEPVSRTVRIPSVSSVKPRLREK